MVAARRVDGISLFAGTDFKRIVAIEGFDMTGETLTFVFGERPGLTAIDTVTGSLLEVTEDEYGVPTSIIELLLPEAGGAAAYAAAGGASAAGADIPVSYELRASALPGDLGTAAEEPLLYGSFILKGAIGG